MIKCNYCKNKATHYRSPDLDIKWIPLCDDKKCHYTLIIDITRIE